MQEVIKKVEKTYVSDRTLTFRPGDTVAVSFNIHEGDKQRVQQFQGVVIQMRGSGIGMTFTVRKSSGNNVYVERVFPLHSPLISDIKIVRHGQVRRAKLYYLRGRVGKATRIKERTSK